MYNLIMVSNDVRREILIGRHLLRLLNFYLRSFANRERSGVPFLNGLCKSYHFQMPNVRRNHLGLRFDTMFARF